MRALILIGLFASAAMAGTRVQDTLYDSQGRRANGVCEISWPTFSTHAGKNVAAGRRLLAIRNGVVDVDLEPTANGTPVGVLYTVRCTLAGSTRGTPQYWSVPAAASATLNQVRVQADGGTSVPILVPRQERFTITSAGQVITISEPSAPGWDIQVYRNGVLIDTTQYGGANHFTVSGCCVITITGGGGSAVSASFVDGETPSGVINGVNTAFTLNTAPSPSNSLTLYRNGLAMKAGLDYSVAGTTITFVASQVPATGDVLLASYRVSGGAGGGPVQPGEFIRVMYYVWRTSSTF